MAASALSPSSSPRLPSPPPIAEDQLGPKSPVPSTEEQQKQFSNLDHGAARRIRPGTKADDMAEGPPLVDLSEIDSAFQLTEHLKALHNFLTHPIGANSTLAVDKDTAYRLAQPPDNVEKTLWLYELCRFLTQRANSIVISLFSDNPPCSANTCPEMRASEWQYLCAVHEPPKSCCAIDYCCHTLDWAANLLTSPKHFPSRLAMGTDQTAQHQQIRHITNIFRRVYRIFAHAWFQHREMFWKVEGGSGLYVFFKTVCDFYGLIPEDNYTIPSEAEGVEAHQHVPPPIILMREPSDPAPSEPENASVVEGAADRSLATAATTKRHRPSQAAGATTISTGDTTKRHRHSPSVGAAVHTVVEENEEDEEQPGKEEDGADASPNEASEASEAVGNDSAIPEEPKIGEEAEAAEDCAPANASDALEAPSQDEKQSASEAEKEDPPPYTEEKESESPEDQTTEAGSQEVEAEQGTETEPEPGEESSAAAPSEKGEAAVEPDTSSDVKETGEKPGAEE